MNLNNLTEFDRQSAERSSGLDQQPVRQTRRAGLELRHGGILVLIDMLSKLKAEITIFTLDTGRLHEETYEVMDRVRSKYGFTIQTYFPDKQEVERLVREKGFFSFRESVDNRKECCFIRKVEPLNRALGRVRRLGDGPAPGTKRHPHGGF